MAGMIRGRVAGAMVGAVVAVLLLIAGPVAAAPNQGGGTSVSGAGTSDGGVVEVAGGGGAGGGGNGGGRTSTIRCRYFEVANEALDGWRIALVAGAEVSSLLPGNLYWKICTDTATGDAPSLDVVDPAGPNPAAVARLLAQQALAQLRVTPPSPRSNPAGGIAVINVATWLWTDGWTPLQRSASAAGVTATITATPLDVTWEPGDGGEAVVCAGPGIAYDLARPASEQSTDCAITYRRAAGRFTVVATQRWSVTYTATNGQSGDLGVVNSTASMPIDVHQLVTAIGLDD